MYLSSPNQFAQHSLYLIHIDCKPLSLVCTCAISDFTSDIESFNEILPGTLYTNVPRTLCTRSLYVVQCTTYSVSHIENVYTYTVRRTENVYIVYVVHSYSVRRTLYVPE